VRWTAISILLFVLAACSFGAADAPSEGAPAAADATTAAETEEEATAAGAASGPAEPEVASEEASTQEEQPAAQDAPPQPLTVVTRPDEQLLVLEVRLRQFVLSDGIFGYLDDGGLILPLGDYVRALEFSIGVDPENGRADGWFLDEDQLFALDLSRSEVVLKGRRKTFDPQLVELHEDDIYVDTRLLAEWFPADIEFDLSNLLVRVSSREPLLVEQRLDRERRRGAALHRRRVDAAEYPEKDVPYRWISWPFVNVSAESGYERNSLGEAAISARYNLLATADLAKMDSSLFVAGENGQGVSQVRLEMGRRDPDGELVGPLGATSYSFGDISTPPVDLIASSRFGRGAQISSFPLDRTGEFDSTTLIGELPLGWEVELYRNEVLLDFQASRADGRFEFEDVQLLFGLNVLRLRFFGPQGQRREEVRRIYVGPGQVPAGEFNFRVAVNQQDEYLIPVDDGNTGGAATQGEARAITELEYGVNKNTSVAASAISLPLNGGRRNYGSLGLRMGFNSLFSRLDIMADDAGGKAAKVGVQVSLPLNLAFLAEHSEFDGFISEEYPDDVDPIARVSELRVDGVIPGGHVFRVPFSVKATREESESGNTDSLISNRLSAAISRISMSNSLEWQIAEGPLGKTTNARGTFLVAGRIGRTTLRGDLQYGVEPVGELTSSTLAVERQFDTDLRGRIAAEKRFTGAETTTYSARLSNRFDLASLGVSGQWTDDDSWSALLSLSFSLGREPRSGDWRVSSRNMADNGSVSARVFLDNDLDGVFGEGDTPVEGARLAAGRTTGREETDENGVVFVTGLQADRRADLTLAPRSLVDPYWVAEPEGYALVPRAGSPATVDFPLVVTGEIDGMVYMIDKGRAYELADVTLQLQAPDGTMVAETKSAFDGFYLFEFVRPGDYVVQVAPEQLARLGFVSSGGKKVTIGGDGTMASGIQFTLTPARGT